MPQDAGTIVVGGGHAGVEAALAAARLGVPTLLITGEPQKICTLPCNPSIGGSAKGQLVREIDALGGAMGRIADRCSLHARFLNESKGPAVRALRQQMDKPSYAALAVALLSQEPNLTIVAGLAEDLLVESGAVRGVACSDGRRYYANRVVLATGTFLGGKSFRGDVVLDEGRFGEAPAIGLAATLRRLGFPTQRLKTGTPPRIDRTTVDFTAMLEQPPSLHPLLFSYASEPRFAGPQLSCYVTQTNERTHALVRENLHRSPLYGLDLIRGIGPRYCPSIEDKVVKFAHNPTHQIFIEPEGWDEPTLYVGGFSTSLPAEVQLEMLRTLPGLESVADAARRIRGRIRHGLAHRAARHARDAAHRRPLPLRPAQRHLRVRRSRRAGPHRRHQRRACGARRRSDPAEPLRGVHRRAHRRSGHVRASTNRIAC